MAMGGCRQAISQLGDLSGILVGRQGAAEPGRLPALGRIERLLQQFLQFLRRHALPLGANAALEAPGLRRPIELPVER